MNLIVSLLISLSHFFTPYQAPLALDSAQETEQKILREDLPAFSNCPVSPHPTQIVQPDNTTITIVGKGTMVNSWTETVDGYTIVLNNGIYEYAQTQNGNLIASGVKANDPVNRSGSEQTFVSGLPRSAKPALSPLRQSVLAQVQNRMMQKTFPTTGNVRILCLLIDYPNLQSTFPASDFDSLLYASNYRAGDGSFKYYYETASDSQITVTVDVAGWYRAANNYLYYSRDSGYARAADLVREAVDAAETNGVNFALYDNDNDNDVDGILAVHSGPGAEQGSRTQYVWSHRWVLNGGNLGSVTYDGKFINDYMINPEIRTSGASQNLVGIGVFCHEFGHNLGLPDLYDTDNSNGGSEGIGNWCLMAGGGWLGGEHRPSNFSAWCRIENNWATPSNLTIGNSSSHSMVPSVSDPNEIYRINTTLSNEYFLLENRQKMGLDRELNGEGLAVWHINTNKTNSIGNSVNADENLKGVDLEEADGNNDLDNEVNRGDNGDLFPGSSNNSTFNSTSNPNSQNYLNNNTGLELRNITENGTTVSFDFGPPPAVTCSGSSTQTTASATFDDGSGNAVPYTNNLNCSWLIQPTSGPINLTFNSFDIDANGDTLYVYDGANNSAGLIGKYNGTAAPPMITSTGNSLFLEFVTDGSTVAGGWNVSYTSGAASASCMGTTNLSGAVGTFADGSGIGSNYSDNLNCSWQIDGTLSTLLLNFDSLDIESTNDSIIIYEGQNNQGPVVATITDNSQAASININDQYAFVEFKTNGSVNAKGWQISWQGLNGCSGSDTLRNTSGTFSDGSLASANYTNNRNCEWLIEPSGATLVILDFNRFDLEANFDFVEVYDGPTTASTRIARLSGNSIPSSVVSSGGSMLVRFTSDPSITFTGFEASYTSSTTHCIPTRTYTANSGSFSDGSGSNNYDPNLNCGWLIQPSQRDTIKIDFTAFDTESNNDVVNIYNGTDNTGTLVATYSGNTLPPRTAVIGNNVNAFVEFVTNSTLSGAGWSINYSSGRALSCNGTTNLTAASGNFNDGSGSLNYDNNLNCGWLIQPPGNPAVITLDFNSMNLAFGGDIVRIYDGTSSAGTLIGSRTGTFIGSTLSAYSGAMFVEFVTNGSGRSQGWSASYNSSQSFCLSSTTFTGNFGNFTDGSPLNQNYLNNTDCSWLIQPSTSNVAVLLTISRLATELNNDTITVYDGSTTADPILGTFSGNTLPSNPVLSSGGSMLVTFKSNGSTTGNGFTAFYNTQGIPACSGTTNLSASSGTFDDGSAAFANYIQNSNCRWLIQPTSASLISLQFNRFNTQPGDTVNVYDGTSSSDPLLGSFSGTSIPPSLFSTGGDLLLTFNSNSFGNSTGWEASYNSSANQCFGNLTLNNPRDTIRDGSGAANYGNNLNCSWLIQPATATSVTLNFLQFDLNNPGDSLKVYDGTSNSDPLLAALSGSSLPSSLSSTGGDMYLEFITDGSGTAAGWEAYYDITSSLSCLGTTTLTAPSGSFSDGSGANNYDNNLNCSWLIQPGGNPASINLNFTSVNTNSFNDRVTVYDGTNNSGTLLGSVFLSNLGNTFTAFSGSMYVEFTTNAFGTAAGWDATYSSSSSYCSANTTLTNNFGVITDGSPSGSNYLNNTNCQWLIQPTQTNIAVRLNFQQLNTQLGVDTVTVYDGTSTNDPILGTFSGGNIPPAVTSSGGDMLLTFISDGSTTQQGFRAVYTTVPIPACAGLTTLTAASGTFDDGSGPSTNYNNNTNCSWLIQPPGAITIDLSFNNFRTENNFDFLRVYDGSNNNGTLLGSFSGGSLPSNLQATSGSMFLEFTSDASITDAGWEVSYTSSNTVNLAANPDTVQLNAALGSQVIFNVSSNSNWTTRDNASWMLTNPINGSGNQSVNVIAIQPNIGPVRYAEVVIEDVGNTVSDTVIVEQLSSGRFLVGQPDTLFFASQSAGSQPINLQSNVNWNLSTSFSWITIGTASGSNNGSSQINVNTNGGAQRIGYIVASGNLGVSNDTIFVKQDPLGRQLSVAPSNLTLLQPMGSTGNFTVNSNVDWQTSTPANWLSIQNPAVTSDTNTVGISTSSMNSSGNSRSSFIAVQDLAGTLFDTVFVTQLGGNPTLSATPDTLVIGSPANSTGQITLTANVSWLANTATPLFGINQTSGTGNATLTISATTENYSAFPVFSFAAFRDNNGSITDTVIILQEGVIPALSISPRVINLNQMAMSSDSAFLFSNTGWTFEGVDPSPAFFGFSAISGVKDDTIRVTAISANTNPTTRTGYIAYRDDSRTVRDTLFINQTGTNPILEANQDTVYLAGSNGSTTNVTFLSNGVWNVTAGAPWFNSNLNVGSSNGNLTLTASSDNNGSAPRISFLALQDINQSLNDTVIVVQDTIITSLAANPDTLTLSANAGAMGNVNVTASVDWNAASAASWFSFAPGNGSGNANVMVTAQTANPNFSDRFDNLIFTDINDPNNTDTVVIRQEGVPVGLTVNPSVLALNFSTGSNDILNVVSNTNWTVNNPVSWLSLSATSGSGNSSLTVTATSDNLSGGNRIANLTFSASGAADVIVTITQIDGTSPSFLFSRDTVYVDFLQGSTNTFSVLGNQANWSLSENTPWLLVNPMQGSNTTTISVLAASRNAFGNIRTATIKGSATGFNDDSLVVVQRPSTPLFQAAPSMLRLGSDSANTVNFNISSNLLSWTLDENSSWMEVSPDSGSFTKRIEVKATETNNSGAIRSGVIQVISPPQVPISISVEQDTVMAIGIREFDSEFGLDVYPNPAREKLIIEGIGIERIDPQALQLFDSKGRPLRLNIINRAAAKIELDFNSEAAGIYYLRYLHEDQMISRKIILLN